MAQFILFYPMQVLSTNRILKTPITKNSEISKINIFRELGELASKGLPGLWRGLIPFYLGQFMHVVPAIFGAAANSVGTPYGLGGVAVGTLIANPFEIASVRYQNVDFRRGNFLGDFWLMYGREKRKLLTTGYLHAYIRNVLMMLGFTYLAEKEQNFVASFLLLSALSQPFEVLRVRQQWAFTDQHTQGTAVGENSIEAGLKVYRQQGITGLFRGFVPRAAFFMAAGYILKGALALKEQNEQ